LHSGIDACHFRNLDMDADILMRDIVDQIFPLDVAMRPRFGRWKSGCLASALLAGLLPSTVLGETAAPCRDSRESSQLSCVRAEQVAGTVTNVVNVRDTGAKGDGKTDDTAALQAAFDEARRRGRMVWLPPGDYNYTNELKIDGIKVSGAGPRTRLLAATPTLQRIIMTGEGPAFACVQILYHDLQRNGRDHGRKGIMVQNASNFLVRNIFFDGQGFGATPEFGGGALFIYRSSDGQILNNHLTYTTADAIHITGGSRNIVVQGNRIEYSGDDGIAVVNYGDSVRNKVLIQNNVVLNNRWGRNISAVGGQDIQILHNYIMSNSADGAGIYIASEPAYKTAGSKDILVQDNVIRDTGGPGKGHGQIMLWTGNDNPVEDVIIRGNTIQSSKRKDLAIVVSNKVNNVVLEENDADGRTTLRRDASIRETGGKAIAATSERAGKSADMTAIPPAADMSRQCPANAARIFE
jgi:polygalacturonase